MVKKIPADHERQMMTMSTAWQELQEALSEHAPSVLPTLNPAATHEQMAELEGVLQLPLPDDVRDYLLVHNGQQDPTRLQSLCSEGRLLDTDAIISTWRLLNELNSAGPVAADPTFEWWHAKYIPLADVEGDHLSVDLMTGEVVMHVHDGAIERNIAPNLREWFLAKLDVLKDERFTKEDGILFFEA